MYRIGVILLLGLGLIAESIGAAESKWRLRTAGDRTDLPPIPTIADSPVKFLSDLLEASIDERSEILGRRSLERRAFWERKVREYEQLPEAFRRARLRTAQLHWYLALMIQLPDELRSIRVEQIPETDRVLVKRRMAQWDKLPGDLRVDILGNIKVMQYFARLVSSSPEQRAVLMRTSSESNNPMNDAQLSWQTLSPHRRQQMFDAYASFFELPKMKQEAAVAKIPVPVRTQLKERLSELLRMQLDERQKCIIALHAFAEMTPEERTIFRGNAQRWRAMDASERQFWTVFVKQLPPLPPMRTSRSLFLERQGGVKTNTGASR